MECFSNFLLKEFVEKELYPKITNRDLLSLRLVCKNLAYNNLLLDLLINNQPIFSDSFVKKNDDRLEILIRNFFYKNSNQFSLAHIVMPIEKYYNIKFLVYDQYYSKFIPPYCETLVIKKNNFYCGVVINHFFNNIKKLVIDCYCNKILINGLAPKIKELYAFNNSLSFIGIKEYGDEIDDYFNFNSFQNLKILNLGFNNLIEFPKFINHLPKLKSLKINNNRITYFPNFDNLFSLEEADMSNNQLSNFNESILKLSSLKKLNLENNRIDTSYFYNDAYFCYSLLKLNVKKNPFTFQKSISNLTDKFPQIKIII